MTSSSKRDFQMPVNPIVVLCHHMEKIKSRGGQNLVEVLSLLPNRKVQSLIGKRVRVEMKGDSSVLEGTLVSVDDYMNLYLEDTAEMVNGERKRILGPVILRGNNIILLTPVEE